MLSEENRKLLAPEMLVPPRESWGDGGYFSWETINRLLNAARTEALSTGELEQEERAHGETIDQRDAVEEALSQAYYLVTGRSPEWSNVFGHKEALEEIDEAQHALRAEISRLRSTREGEDAALIGELLAAQQKHNKSVLRGDAYPTTIYSRAANRLKVVSARPAGEAVAWLLPNGEATTDRRVVEYWNDPSIQPLYAGLPDPVGGGDFR